MLVIILRFELRFGYPWYTIRIEGISHYYITSGIVRLVPEISQPRSAATAELWYVPWYVYSKRIQLFI